MLQRLSQLKDLCNSKRRLTVAVACPTHRTVMDAVVHARVEISLDALLFGKKEEITQFFQASGYDVNHYTIIDCPDEVSSCSSAVQAVHSGTADFLMKGDVSTATIMKAVLNKEWGLLQGELLSHVALIESPHYHKLLAVTDGAINIAPTLSQKASILENSVQCLHALGVENPKVALLAALEKVNEKMVATVDAAELKKMAGEGAFSACTVDGPFALDNAVSKDAAKTKNLSGEVAGDADILLAPNLECGNILYKSLNFLGGAVAAAVVMGARKPVVLSSRADSSESRYYSIILAAAIAGEY